MIIKYLFKNKWYIIIFYQLKKNQNKLIIMEIITKINQSLIIKINCFSSLIAGIVEI